MISDRQNTEINIQRLAAQLYLYSRAKLLHFIRLILTLPTIFILSIFVALLKSKQVTGFIGMQTYDLSWLLALGSLVVFVLDRLILEPVQQGKKATAAAVQEEFDCDVLQIPWNEIELPKRPVRENIVLNGRHYLSKYGPDKLYNWYACPDDNLVSLPAARLICQRANVSWDAGLRKRYIGLLLIFGIFVSIGIVAFAVAYGVSLRGLLVAVVAPILPVAGFVVGEIRQNRTAVKCLEEIRDLIEEQWKTVLSCNPDNDDLLHKSRQLQDRIYACRKASTLIPDWFYQRLRPSNEALMVATAEEMEQQYLAQRNRRADTDKPCRSG